ncbi:MAG: hypothetical protein ACTMKY_00845 [Dermabacteraceae bacterium]|uniref:hypothetical protein n=1 Tax=Brachybacterium TaxID=43668 RepID=UPI003F923A13
MTDRLTRTFDHRPTEFTTDIPRSGSIAVQWQTRDATAVASAYTIVAVTLPDRDVDVSRQWHNAVDDTDDDHAVLIAVRDLIEDALRHRLAGPTPAEKAVRYGVPRRR